MGLKVNRTGTKPSVERGTDGTRAVFKPASLASAVALNAAAVAAKNAAEAAAAAAAAVGATHDAQTAANVATGPLTGAALEDAIDAQVPASSTTAQGKVELATNTEAAAGSDTVRGVTPATLRYALGNGQIASDLSATIGDQVETPGTPANVAAADLIADQAPKAQARVPLLSRKLFGGNIVPKHGQDWHGFWGEWDWDNWIKPQVDRAFLLGMNGVRVIGGPRVISVAQSGYAGPITQATLDSRWSQLAAYCASKGLALYPALGSTYDFDALGQGYQGAAITASLKTSAAVLSQFSNVIAFDVMQEADLRYGRLWIASTVVSLGEKRTNGSRAYVCTTAGTTASSGGPTGTGTGIADGTAVWSHVATVFTVADGLALLAALRTVSTLPMTYSNPTMYGDNYGWAEGSYNTFFDQIHLDPAGTTFVDAHMSTPSSITVAPIPNDIDMWSKRYGKQILIGEIGAPQDLASTPAQARFTAAAAIHNRRDVSGSFVWSLADQSNTSTNQYGVWDNTGFVQGSAPLSTTSGQRTGLTGKFSEFRRGDVPAVYAPPNLVAPRQARPRGSGLSSTGWAAVSNAQIVSDARGLGIKTVAGGSTAVASIVVTGTAAQPIVVRPDTWYRIDIEMLAATTGRAIDTYVGWWEATKTSGLATYSSISPGVVTKTDAVAEIVKISQALKSTSDAAFVQVIVRVPAAAATDEVHYVLSCSVTEL